MVGGLAWSLLGLAHGRVVHGDAERCGCGVGATPRRRVQWRRRSVDLESRPKDDWGARVLLSGRAPISRKHIAQRSKLTLGLAGAVTPIEASSVRCPSAGFTAAAVIPLSPLRAVQSRCEEDDAGLLRLLCRSSWPAMGPGREATEIVRVRLSRSVLWGWIFAT